MVCGRQSTFCSPFSILAPPFSRFHHRSSVLYSSVVFVLSLTVSLASAQTTDSSTFPAASFLAGSGGAYGGRRRGRVRTE